jgi:hypothetical protein
VKIHERQNDFIDEWIGYDSQIRNPKDDVLDAVELALRTAGILLGPVKDNTPPQWLVGNAPTGDIHQMVAKDIYGLLDPGGHDENLGSEW